MNAAQMINATREQLAEELGAACEYTEDWQTATMDDLRERVRAARRRLAEQLLAAEELN